MNDIRLIVSDIDGTLVDSKGILNNETIEAVRSLKSHGISFALATGRNNNLIYDIVELLGKDICSISNNGALVVDHKTNSIIYRNTLDQTQSRYILNQILDHGWEFICYSIDGLYYSYRDGLVDSRIANIEKGLPENNHFHHALIRNVDDIEDLDSLLKIGVREELCDVDMDIVAEIADSVGAELQNSGELYNCIFPKNISKQTGLMKLQEYLNIGPDNTATIGDYDNDLPLFERARYKVAVANASEKLKEYANIFISSNNNNGVSEYIDTIIRNI